MHLGLAITRSARRYPDRTAVFEGDRQRTYAGLDARTNRLANALRGELGLDRGERVTLLVPNRLEVVEVLGGVAKAGLVYVGLDHHLAWTELRAIIDNAGPTLLLHDRETAPLAAQAAERFGLRVIDLDDDGPDGFEALLARAGAELPPAVHETYYTDDCCIVYTSGTTGLPKGVLFEHRAVIDHALVTCMEYEIKPNSRFLMLIPHKSCVNITIAPCLTMGAAMGFSSRHGFDGRAFAEEVHRQRITHSFLVPTMLFRLLEQLPEAEDALLESIETIGYGSAPMSPDRIRTLVDRFGPVFNQLYGMTETASIATMLRKEDHVRGLEGAPHVLRSAGQPSYAMAVRVVGDDGHDVRPGKRGEVLFASSYNMKGYYRDPERTTETLRDGWVRSGDVAEVDEDGYIYIVDRKKNLIIRGGQNIAPTEIENVLFAHPAVLEASVVGVPDEEWGEAVCAAVLLKEGASTSVEALKEWCREHELGRLKIPERIALCTELPKNSVGKTDKIALRGLFTADNSG